MKILSILFLTILASCSLQSVKHPNDPLLTINIDYQQPKTIIHKNEENHIVIQEEKESVVTEPPSGFVNYCKRNPSRLECGNGK